MAKIFDFWLGDSYLSTANAVPLPLGKGGFDGLQIAARKKRNPTPANAGSQ